MKIIILAVLTYAALLEAYPHDALGLVGKGISSGIAGSLGLGVGSGVGLGMIGVEEISDKAQNLGLGAVELGSGLAEGAGTGFSTGLQTGLGLFGVGKEPQIGGDGYRQKQQRQQWQQQQRRRGNQGYNSRGQRQYADPIGPNSIF